MVMQRPRAPVGRSAGDRGPVHLALSITPGRHLVVRAGESDGEDPLAPEAAARIAAAFEAGAGAGLLQLGTAEVTTPLPAALGYWRDLAVRYVTAVCARGEDTATPILPPD